LETLSDQAAVQVGRYRLIAELAHGGMGDVYLGVAQGPMGFSKLMVIKMLRPALADDEQFLAMFLEEARLAARLNHPNVVQTVEVGNEGKRYFLAMEYLEGQSLQRMRTRIAKDHPFPLGPHLRMLVEALNGLHYAHELVDIDGNALHIVHRDATPHNIFVTYDGQVKVVDFGIAKAMDSSLETRTGELKGKIAYMPPEQASAQRVDRRADVFAMGVMLWEAAVGRRLWKGLNEIAIMHELITGHIPSAREVEPRVSPELDAICQRALAQNPNDRYATAADFANEIERYLHGIGDRTTSRDIGTMVSQSFEADRRELREIIDQQLRMLRQGSERLSMPKLPTALGQSSGSGSQAGGVTPSVPSIARPSAAQLDKNAAPSFTTGGTASAAGVPIAPAPRTSLGMAAAMIAVAACVLGAIIFFVLHNGSKQHEGPVPIVQQANTRPAAESIDVTVTANPPTAQLFLDDAPLGPSPYHATFPRDGLTHRVRAEQVFYAPRTEIIVFDKPSAAIELTLLKGAVIGVGTPGFTPRPPPPPITTHTATTTTTATATTTTTGPHKPPRTIDTSFGGP
jgi:serine/threonine protein kinase